MSAKANREILKAASSRGWIMVRQGAHNQLILEYPQTGARMAIMSTPRVRPAVRDIMRRLEAKERSTSTAYQKEVLEFLWKRSGVHPDGYTTIRKTITDIAVEYFEVKDVSEIDVRALSRFKHAVAQSDRVWMTTFSTKGSGGVPTERLILGRDAILNEEQVSLVQSVPQVNGVLIGQKSVSETRAEMAEFLKARRWLQRKNGNWSQPDKGWYGLRTPDAFAKAQGMSPLIKREPITTVIVKTDVAQMLATPVPEVTSSTSTWSEARVADEHGVVAVDGEEPVAALPSDEDAAEMIGLPVSLVKALRDYLKIDNKNVISGVDMVREALGVAVQASEALTQALDDLGQAIDLIKAEG